MMKYVLSGEQAVDINAGMIEFRVKGNPAARLRLECDGVVRESGPHGWMAESIAGRAQLYVVLKDGAGPEEGQVHLSLSSANDQVSMSVVATGHSSLLVLRLRPVDAGRLRVSSVAGISLPPLAAEARALASQELETHGARLDRGLGRDIAVTVDGSASMAWLAGDAVPAVLECLAGLDYLAGSDDALEMRIAGVATTFSGVAANEVRARFTHDYSVLKGVVAPDLWNPSPTGKCAGSWSATRFRLSSPPTWTWSSW